MLLSWWSILTPEYQTERDGERGREIEKTKAMYGSQGKKQKQQSHRNQDGYLIQEKKRPRINGIDGLFFFREKNERKK